jgi:hypothetical protein
MMNQCLNFNETEMLEGLQPGGNGYCEAKTKTVKSGSRSTARIHLPTLRGDRRPAVLHS